MSLNICKEPSWKVNIVHKQCLETMIIPSLSTMMVKSKHPVAWNVTVTNVDKTSNLINIALKFQKLLNISQAFVEKTTEFVK
jgi:hypothetical protein